MSDSPPPVASDEFDNQFHALLVEATGIPTGPARIAALSHAFEFAKREHYAAEPPPAAPDPLTDLRRDCVLHLRMCDLLELGELFDPPGLLSGFTRRIDNQMRRIYATGAIRRQPPPPPDLIPTNRTGERGWLIDPAREMVKEMLRWCDEARGELASTDPTAKSSDSRPGTPIPNAPAANVSGASGEPNADAGRRHTLGQLVGFLDDLERNREFHRLNQQEQLRRDPVGAAVNAVYSAALRWRPDEGEMPGIRRIELLCDLEPGEAGINAAKARRLRARICQQQRWQTRHADELTLDEAADLLDGVQRVTIDELKQVSRDQLHHGHATLDMIGVGSGQAVQVTGLSCKVIAGTIPTACPDANPVLPPSMLPLAEQAIRRLHELPNGTTVHWVGHDTGVRNRCRCHPTAPFAAPFDRHRWAAVVEPANRASAVGLVTTPGDTTGSVCLRDHAGREHSVPLATCQYHERPVRPDYLAQMPDRLGDPWLVERLVAGRDLELWVTRDGFWFVLDRERSEAVVLNGDQLRDLRECPAVTTTTTPGPTSTTRTPTPRVRCEEPDRSVYLDGKRLVGEVELALFRFFRVIAEAYPDPIAFKAIQRHTPGLYGKHSTRDLKNRLPVELAPLVESGKHGYRLTLPDPK